MAYRFKLDETLQDGLRRIANEQANKVINRLNTDIGNETTIHRSRKALKRLKALFKLARGGFSKQVYAREYRVIRDVARSLSGARDLDVMPVTLTMLSSANVSADPVAIDQARKAVERARAELNGEIDRAAIFAAAIGDLAAARQRYEKLELRDDTFAILSAGAAKGLRTLRRQHDVAIRSDEDEDYHDWRKSAQLHWRQLRLLSETWPDLIAARITVAKGLADTLGYDHDLTVLGRFLGSIPASRLKASRRKALLAQIHKRQLELRAEARAHASLLVVDEPADFAEKLYVYHNARAELEQLLSPLCNSFAQKAGT